MVGVSTSGAATCSGSTEATTVGASTTGASAAGASIVGSAAGAAGTSAAGSAAGVTGAAGASDAGASITGASAAGVTGAGTARTLFSIDLTPSRFPWPLRSESIADCRAFISSGEAASASLKALIDLAAALSFLALAKKPPFLAAAFSTNAAVFMKPSEPE